MGIQRKEEFSIQSRQVAALVLDRGIVFVFCIWSLAVAVLHVAGAEILLADAVPPTLLAAFLLGLPAIFLIARDTAREGSKSSLIQMATESWELQILFFLIVAMHVLMSFRAGAYWEESARLVFLPLYDWLIFLLACCLGATRMVARKLRFFAQVAFWALVTSIVYDLVSPGALSKLATRAAGFPRNSNASAFFTILLLSVFITFERPRLRDIFMMAVGGIAVFLTLSRGGMIIYLFVAAYLLYRSVTMGSAGSRAGRLALIALAIVCGVSLAGVLSQTEMFSLPAAARRLAMFSGGQFLDFVEDSRAKLVFHYLSLIDESPWIGHGTAFSWAEPKGPHNMFLHFWVSLGVIGVILFCAFLLGSWLYFHRRGDLSGQIFVLVSVLQALLSHNMLDQRPWLILLGSLIGSRSMFRPTSHQRVTSSRSGHRHLE